METATRQRFATTPSRPPLEFSWKNLPMEEDLSNEQKKKEQRRKESSKEEEEEEKILDKTEEEEDIIRPEDLPTPSAIQLEIEMKQHLSEVEKEFAEMAQIIKKFNSEKIEEELEGVKELTLLIINSAENANLFREAKGLSPLLHLLKRKRGRTPEFFLEVVRLVFLLVEFNEANKGDFMRLGIEPYLQTIHKTPHQELQDEVSTLLGIFGVESNQGLGARLRSFTVSAASRVGVGPPPPPMPQKRNIDKTNEDQKVSTEDQKKHAALLKKKKKEEAKRKEEEMKKAKKETKERLKQILKEEKEEKKPQVKKEKKFKLRSLFSADAADLYVDGYDRRFAAYN